MKHGQRTCAILGIGVLGLLLLAPATAAAQAEWVRRLDDDHNGYIEPDEISDRSREYLERFARPYGLSLRRPNRVDHLEEAARRYYARRERDDDDDRVELPAGTVRDFEPDEAEPLIPGFGADETRFPYTREDLERAAETIDRSDRDDDGMLDSEEIARARWRGRDPYDVDFNRDRILSKTELAQRYARRRIVERMSRLSLGVESDEDARDRDDNDNDDRRSWRSRSSRAGQSRDGDRGSRSLAESILQRYDFNRNDLLDASEMDSVGLSMARVDYDRDGRADRNELAQFLFKEFENEASASAELIPTWFFERDIDGDDQVLMSEFTDQWTAEKMSEFKSFDLNQDGIITSEEILSAKSIVGGEFSNQQAQILLPRSTVVSEIEVEDDYLIGDLDVELSITHTYTDHLDGYLIGPDGERIELFTSVGGSDDHFDRTVFDDEAERNINRGRAPFRGHYQPESMAHRKPGLSRYRGKNLKGIWQLMIRGSRSDRSGILHGWSLNVEPQREAVDQLEAEPQPAEEAAEADN